MSSKIVIIPFQDSHLERIDIHPSYPVGECPKTVMTTAFTLLDGHDVIAIIGGFPFIPGVIHFWGLLSKLVSRRPLDFHKTCMKVLHWYEDNEKPRRVQIDVRADYSMGCRWAESLGFKREGLMKHWGPDGADFYLYGRASQWP